jgi:hypothetical protein
MSRIGGNVRLIPQTVDRHGRAVADVNVAMNLSLAIVGDGMT